MFLASEEDEPVRYILVPFNDYRSISTLGFLINVKYMPASRLHVTLSQGWAGMVAKHLKQQRSEVTDDFQKGVSSLKPRNDCKLVSKHYLTLNQPSFFSNIVRWEFICSLLS